MRPTIFDRRQRSLQARLHYVNYTFLYMKLVNTMAQLPRMKNLYILAMPFHVCLTALRDRVNPLNRLDEKREFYNLNNSQRYGSTFSQQRHDII